MKETDIKLRLSSDLKTKFKNKCNSENTTMTNKLLGFINNDIYSFDEIVITPDKSIRYLLVKSILNKVIIDLSFEYVDDFKVKLEKALHSNLTFEIIVSDIKSLSDSNAFYGEVFFKLEDGTVVNITFNVTS